MNYVIGIDGGGTKAHLCAADADRNLLFEAFGGGTNLCSLPEQQVEETLHTLLRSAMQALSGKPLAVCIGSAGVVDDTHRKTLAAYITSVTGPLPVLVFNDSQTALRGNLGTRAGISITAGTGTICLAQDGQGNTLRLSGWGHIFSDEGSAYDIVRRSLTRICLAHDRRSEPTAMTALFLESTNSRDFDELVTRMYTAYASKEKFASLAVLTDRAAEQGDAAARQILSDTAAQLFAVCDAAAARLYAPGQPFSVVESGGVFAHCARVRQEFEKRMLERYPQCTLTFGGHGAIGGAVSFAWDAANAVL